MKKSNISAHAVPLGAGQFFGATRGQFRTGEFVVTTVTHSQSRVVPMHVHANPFFSMLINGGYREWFGREHWDARPLAMVLRPPQAEHHDEIGPGGAVFLCVDVAQKFWDAMASADIRLERRAFDSRPMSCSALRLLREMIDRRPGWPSAAESLIAELIEEYTRDPVEPRRREPRWLRRALERLHAEPFTANLGSIAMELDLHPVHVTRIFKRHLGVTLSSYLRQLRLHHATRALLESTEPLATLADSHGFADQSHLTRALNRGTGWTPGRLRCACERLRSQQEGPAQERAA